MEKNARTLRSFEKNGCPTLAMTIDQGSEVGSFQHWAWFVNLQYTNIFYALHATLQFSNHRLVGLEANLSSKNIMFGIRVACKSASELLALTTVPFWEALRLQQENGGWGVEVGLSQLETNFTPE